jgi:hypothetical protein
LKKFFWAANSKSKSLQTQITVQIFLEAENPSNDRQPSCCHILASKIFKKYFRQKCWHKNWRFDSKQNVMQKFDHNM